MSLAHEVTKLEGTPRRLDVQADVTLGADPAGGFKLTGINLIVSGDVEGLDASAFESAAEAAKVGCPVSKALAGVDIMLQLKK
jgi:osmotically inducible protein OsmC